MKEIKKIDNYKRIRIPVEFQNYLGWKIGDEIEVEVVDNDIILRKHENVPDLNVELQNNIKIEPSNKPIEFSNDGNEEDSYIEQAKEETQEETNMSERLQRILTTLEKPSLIRNETIKIPTIEQYFNLNTTKVEEPKVEEIEESKVEEIEESKVEEIEEPKVNLLDKKDELNEKLCPKCRQPIENSRFKLNHKYICRDCRNKLKNKLYFEITCKKERLK